MAAVAVLGTLDTKGEEHFFLAHKIHSHGHDTLLINVGTGGSPTVEPDISLNEVASAANIDLESLLSRQDRGECVSAMSRAASKFVTKLVADEKIDGIISLGGGGGTAIATAAMRALPIGFPKVMVSTLAATDTSSYLGTKDIVMIPSVTDIAGLNRLSRLIFSRATGAICGMIEEEIEDSSSKPLIVASMFGNTTKCISEARKVMEDAGYEVLVFAATGTGGRAMESLIESGMVDGVLDITTTELADELVGGILSAGPDRMNAAARASIPTVVVPGCLDMVNFGEKESVPSKFAGRNFYIHNPQVTLMRTTPDECIELGSILANKANRHGGAVTIMVPKCALSEINGPGQPFYYPEADEALFASIRRNAKVEVKEFEEEINSPKFARACAEQLLENIRTHKL